jgi:uncharacterized protein (TIGR02001 family)
MHAAWRSGASCLLLSTASAAACAQFGGSIGVDSDYRFRGVTLSDSRPDARIGITYDHTSGWYAGASLTRVIFEPEHYHAALLAYAGYTQPWSATLQWEVGATRAAYDGDARYSYNEAYAGIVAERWSTRVYLSGNYFGSDVQTGYVELDGGWPVTSSLRAIGHVGALVSLRGELENGMSRVRTDARIGMRWRVDDGLAMQLAWSGSSTGGPYPSYYERKPGNVVLSLSYAF